MILTIGDSFTRGEELQDMSRAWPHLLGQPVTNFGESGSSNDTMVRKAIDATLTHQWSCVIVAWTHPSRFECWNEKIHQPITIMPESASGLPWCDDYYRYSYNESYAFKKWIQQILLLQSWFKQRMQEYLFVSVNGLDQFQSSLVSKELMDAVDQSRYVGWPGRGFIQIADDAPRGSGGHPLELGHERIANEIRKHIGN